MRVKNLVSIIFIFLLPFTLISLVMAQIPEPTDEQLQEMGMTREEYNAAMSAYMGSESLMQPTSIESGLYVNDQDGYSIDIPEGWQGMYLHGGLIVSEGNMEQMMQNMGGASIVITKDNAEEDGNNDPTQDLDFEHADLSVIKMALQQSMNSEEGIKSDVTSVTRVSVAGQSAVRAIIIMTPVDPQMAALMRPTQNAMHFIHYNELDYNVVFSTPVGEWEKYQSLFSKTLESFQFNDN